MAPTSMGAGRSATQQLLRQVGTVYTETTATGKYTTVLHYSLACRLVYPSYPAPYSSAQRAELMADRDLWWDPSVALPEQCRISIDNVFWQPRAGTFQALGDGQTVVARRCAVIRVQVASF